MPLPTDCTELTLYAQEGGEDAGFINFMGYVVHHATMGTTRQTVFARVPCGVSGELGGFVIMEQSPHRCTISTCETEEELRRLVPGAVIEAPEGGCVEGDLPDGDGEDLLCRNCGGQLIATEDLSGSVALRAQDVGRTVGEMKPATVDCTDRTVMCVNCDGGPETIGYNMEFDLLIPMCATAQGREIVFHIHTNRCDGPRYGGLWDCDNSDEVLADLLDVIPRHPRLRTDILRNRRWMSKAILAACED